MPSAMRAEDASCLRSRAGSRLRCCRSRFRTMGRASPLSTTILTGAYRSVTGMGLGISGSRRLMDRFHIETAPGRGTTVTMGKLLPPAAILVTPQRLGEISSRLVAERAPSMLSEVQQQNRELLETLDQLRRRQDELLRLNSELEDTNRGVVALYAELDEKADHLRRADEMKSKFLSNMSHEFRTPLNSMLALTRLLLERIDGELTSEQETQVSLVRGRRRISRSSSTICSTWRRSKPARSRFTRASSRFATCSVLCAGCCGRCSSATPSRSSSTSRRACRRCAPTRQKSRRSSGTSSRTPEVH